MVAIIAQTDQNPRGGRSPINFREHRQHERWGRTGVTVVGEAAFMVHCSAGKNQTTFLIVK